MINRKNNNLWPYRYAKIKRIFEKISFRNYKRDELFESLLKPALRRPQNNNFYNTSRQFLKQSLTTYHLYLIMRSINLKEAFT